MKLLLVNTHCGYVGGVERYIAAIAKLLIHAGHQVYGLFEDRVSGADGFARNFTDVFMLADHDQSWRTRLQIDLAILNKTASPELIRDLRQRFKTMVFFHDHDYYCPRHHKYFPFLHGNCHRPFSLLGCALCTALLEKRNGRIHLVNLWRQHRLITEIRSCHGYLVMSEYMRNNLLLNGYPAAKIHKIYPVQEPISGAASERQPGSVVYIGQLIRGKGIDLLLAAFAGLPDNVKLTIVGCGNQEPELRQLVKRKQWENRVTFTGWVDEPERYLQQAAVAAVPSRWQEPFGLVGIEALACQTPVVGFDVGGIREWLTDRENGLLVPERNVHALREALRTLLGNPELAVGYGRNGAEKVRKEFSAETFLQRFEKISAGGHEHV